MSKSSVQQILQERWDVLDQQYKNLHLMIEIALKGIAETGDGDVAYNAAIELIELAEAQLDAIGADYEDMRSLQDVLPGTEWMFYDRDES